MARELGFLDRVSLAFDVVARWETLVTIAAFIAIWLLLRYVADPWAKEDRAARPRTLLRSFLPRKRAKKAPVPEAPPPEDEDSEFPDD